VWSPTKRHFWEGEFMLNNKILDQQILEELESYIHIHLYSQTFSLEESIHIESEMYADIQSNEIEDFIKIKRKPSLNQVLFGFIDKKGSSDSEIYKKAGIDRRHFSKIRSNLNYRPSKSTTLALAFALELNREEIKDLLDSAGYSLSDSDTSDLIIQFCLEKRIYDIHYVNQALDHFNLKPLNG
jgi:hypothetical protein